MGASGGFTFLVVYLVLAVLCGFIVMVGELALGRKTGKGVVSAYHVLSKRFKWLGWLGILSPFFILFFYCALGGYCIKYVVVNVGDLFGASFGSAAFAEVAAANGTSLGAEVFNAFMGNPTEAIIYGLIFVALTMLIVMGGVSGGIEKVCSVGMPALFVMLLICIVRACTLPGAVNGLKYMFVPGWAVANGIIEEAPNFLTVLSTAGGQMFFSLSLGMGIMITYGSYLDKKENLQKNAILIIVMDTLVALMAGLCVIPGRFALDPSRHAGRPQAAVRHHAERVPAEWAVLGAHVRHPVLPAGGVCGRSPRPSPCWRPSWLTLCDKARDAGKGDKRKTYSLIAAAVVGLGCILICADSLGGAGISPVDSSWACRRRISWPCGTTAGWTSSTCMSEGILMPLGALLMSTCVSAGSWAPTMVDDECCLEGQSFKMKGFFNICVKFITPLCMLLVLYGQIREFFF
ncbi:MAG: sodium-dependent transporter [Oscillospiraceae bacterium]